MKIRWLTEDEDACSDLNSFRVKADCLDVPRDSNESTLLRFEDRPSLIVLLFPEFPSCVASRLLKPVPDVLLTIACHCSSVTTGTSSSSSSVVANFSLFSP